MRKWLRLPGKPEGQYDWNVFTCHAAAMGGDLEMLKWLRLPGKPEGQCDWDENTCLAAAKEGHVEVLKWARLPDKPEGQCPWLKSYCWLLGSAATGTWIGTQFDDCGSDDDVDY